MKCTQSLCQELSASGGKLVVMKCDVRKEEDILSMMSEIKSQLGGADICVNSAGLANDAPLLSGTTEKWREELEVIMCSIVKRWLIRSHGQSQSQHPVKASIYYPTGRMQYAAQPCWYFSFTILVGECSRPVYSD